MNAIQFINVDENNNDTMSVNQEAVDFLSAIEGKIAVLAVAGLYRTGKSFLLNLLLGWYL